MKHKIIKLDVYEYEQLKKTQELLIEQGTIAIVCPHCEWRPKNIDFSDGGTIGVAMEVFLHFINNPECFDSATNKI